MTGDEDGRIQVRGDSWWGCSATIISVAIGIALVIMACAWAADKAALQ
jgi:hypothetical protein